MTRWSYFPTKMTQCNQFSAVLKCRKAERCVATESDEKEGAPSKKKKKKREKRIAQQLLLPHGE